MAFGRRKRRAKRAPLTAAKLRKQEVSMRSTALPAELAPVVPRRPMAPGYCGSRKAVKRKKEIRFMSR